MDPLSLSASIIALLQLASTAVSVLNDVKNAPEARADCAIEASNLLNLLTRLRYRLESATGEEPWFTAIRSLAVQGGPFDQLKDLLERLVLKLKPKKGLEKVATSATWTLSKKDVHDILANIDRLKLDVQMALDDDHFKLSQAIHQNVKATHDLATSWSDDTEDRHRREILDWLSSEEYAAQQLDFRRLRQEGSGQWLLKAPVFQTWFHGQKGTLFCPGDPGVGKTIIASLVVDHIQQTQWTDRTGLVYIYCNYKRQQQQDTVSIVLTILKQLLEHQNPIPERSVQLHRDHAIKRTRPNAEESLNALSEAMKYFSKVFFILDALDECDMSNQVCSTVLKGLRNLQLSHDLRLLTTSRHIPDIETEFTDCQSIEISASQSDVSLYLDTQIPLLPIVRRHPQLQDHIKTKIADSIEGMFLLAKLYVDALKSKRTRAAVDSALGKISTGSASLSKAYDDAIERIDAQSDDDSELAHRALSWITLSPEALQLEKLRAALAVGPDSSDIDEANLLEPEDISSVCAGLVVVHEETKVIAFVHYTTQEYFKEKLQVWVPDALTTLALTSMAYIKCTGNSAKSHGFPDIAVVPSERDCADKNLFEMQNTSTSREEPRTNKSLFTSFPFLDHAIQYWGVYVRQIQGDPIIKQQVLQFCGNRKRFRWPDYIRRNSRFSSIDYDYFPPLHALAHFDLQELMEQYMAHYPEQNINETNTELRTPFVIAASEGSIRTIQWLLSRGDVDIHIPDIKSWQALHYAAMLGHEETVKRLLGHPGINPNLEAGENGWSGTPLYIAIGAIKSEVVNVLARDQRVDINVRSKGCVPPLIKACESADDECLKALLARKDLDIHIKSQSGMTALHSVAKNGREENARLLLEREDIDVNSLNNDGRSPLMLAALFRNFEVAKLLLNRKDLSLGLRDKFRRTALWYARHWGSSSILNLILESSTEEDKNECFADSDEDEESCRSEPGEHTARDNMSEPSKLSVALGTLYPDAIEKSNSPNFDRFFRDQSTGSEDFS